MTDYDLINNKQAVLELSILFHYPPNSSPEQCEAISARRLQDQPGIDYGYIVRDMEGEHRWRNAHTGEEEVSNGLSQGFRNGWVIKPTIITAYNEWQSWGQVYQGAYHIYHWVLCDNLTDDQVQAWEGKRRVCLAKSRAIFENQPKSAPLQLKF